MAGGLRSWFGPTLCLLCLLTRASADKLGGRAEARRYSDEDALLQF